jgi:nitrogen regulatory protein P-II 1
MTKVEAVIQTSKLDSVKDALHEIGVEGMTVLEARGHGRQKGHTEFYRGREYTVDLIPKIKLEMVLPDERVEAAVQAITSAARTGKIGDGKIFLTRVDDAIRIRNDERGDIAL